MYGNVWEWVRDWYETYLIGAVIDPQGSASGISRVFRGGGRSNVAWRCGSSSHGYRSLESRFDAVGFRVLRTVS